MDVCADAPNARRDSPWLKRTSPVDDVVLVFIAVLFDRRDDGTGGEVT
jgi:hypothetical protein